MIKGRKTRFIAVLLIIIAVASFTGCTSGNEKASSKTEQPVKSLTMWKFRSNKEDYVISQWVKQWNEENPAIQVNFELLPYNDYLTNRLPTAFATNSAPNIYMISAGGFLKYAKAGYMMPLDDFISPELKKDLNRESLKIATYNNKILGIPIEREPVALFYNKQVFSEHKLEPPETWDELVNCAKLLQTKDMSGICLPMQVNDYQNFIFYTFLMQAGTTNDQLNIAAEFGISGTKALKLWRELAKYNYAQETSVEIPSDIYPFGTGKSAMQVCGFWAVNMLNKYYPKLKYGVVPVPSPEGGRKVSVHGGWYQAVNPGNALSAEAADFTIWMWGEDISRPFEWCTEASTKIPARSSVIEKNKDIFNSGINSLFTTDILPISVPEPRYPVEISNAISNALQDAMHSEKDIQEIAGLAGDNILKYINSNNDLFK